MTNALKCIGDIQNVKNVFVARMEPTAVMPEPEVVPANQDTQERDVAPVLLDGLATHVVIIKNYFASFKFSISTRTEDLD